MSYSSKNPKISTTILTDQTTSSVSAAPSSSHRLINRSGNLWLVDSSGVERPVGGASSGINYLADWFNGSKAIGTVATVAANGNITVAGSKPLTNSAWYADATSGAAAIALSSSTALRFSSNYLTALSGSSASGATFVQTAAFTVDDSDLGKPVSISFDLTGVTTADDWDIVVARYTVSGTTGTYAELIPVAGTASSITGTPGAQLPTGTTQFRGFFVAGTTSTDVYALRFRRRTGTTQIRIDSLTVGPQSLAQGAVVTGWQSYTPTISNITIGNGTVTAKYRRVGNNLEAWIDFQSGTTTTFANTDWTFTIPSGINIDSSIDNGNVGYFTFGVASGRFNDALNGQWRSGLVGRNNATTVKVFITPNAANYTTNAWKSTTTGVSNSLAGTSFSLYFLVPIAEWSSGTTTLADRAVEEYAWNTTTTAANDTSSFGYGVDGVLFPNITAFGTSYSKRVRFQTQILPTDNIFVEYLLSGAGAWRNASQIFPLIKQGTSSYGIQLTNVSGSTTDVDVQFRAQGSSPSNGTYAGNGDAWSTFFADGTKWRLRKVASGAAVGFPVSARNIVGDTSGTAVAAGYVGEVRTFTSRTVAAVTTGFTANSSALDTLTAGTWQVFTYNTATATTSATYAEVIISSNSNNDSTGSLGQFSALNTTNLTSSSWTFPGVPFTINVSSTQALYAKSQSYGANRNIAVAGYAVRIA